MPNKKLLLSILFFSFLSINAQEFNKLKDIKYYMLNDKGNEGKAFGKDGYIFKYTKSNNFGIQYGYTYFSTDGKTVDINSEDEKLASEKNYLTGYYVENNYLCARIYTLDEDQPATKVKSSIKIDDILKKSGISFKYKFDYRVTDVFQMNNNKIILHLEGYDPSPISHKFTAFYAFWDPKEPDELTTFHFKEFPVLNTQNNYESTNKNMFDDGWSFMGFYSDKFYYSTKCSHEVKNGFDSSFYHVAVFNTDGTLNSSFLLNNKLPNSKALIQIIGSSYDNKSAVCNIHFDWKNECFYTLSCTKLSKRSDIVMEISKYDLNGTLIWNNSHQVKVSEVENAIEYRGVLDMKETATGIRVVIQGNLENFYYDINSKNGDVIFNEDKPGTNSTIDKDVLTIIRSELKKTRSLDLDENNITKINDHNYFVAYHGKGRSYCIYHLKY